MSVVVIACYRPKPGREEDLLEEARQHVPILRDLGLVTDRTPIVMRAADGTIVEVFEWVSQEAIDRAHEDQTVLAMWRRYAEVCDYVPIGEVAEAAGLFSGFEPVEI